MRFSGSTRRAATTVALNQQRTSRGQFAGSQKFQEEWQNYHQEFKNKSSGNNGGSSYAAMSQTAAAIVGTAAVVGGVQYACNRMPTADPVNNTAFVFIKPHANTAQARAVVKQTLQSRGLTVLDEGLITGPEIEKKQLIDNHYYAIASKATLLSPDQLNVPEEKFKKKFGLEWSDALKKGVVFNAKQACEKHGLTPDQLNTEWAKAKKAEKLVKFGGGFYCGKIDTIPGKEPMYVFNGFFMTMRQGFVDPKASIYYYVVEWKQNRLSWEDFRGAVLGPTDPATAPADSLRGMFMKNWASYGLSSCPNVGDNAVHASASPFEGLAERMNWLGLDPSKDSFGQLVLKQIGRKTLDEWKVDPQVTYGIVPMKKSVFDSVEDTDSDYCLALLGMLYQQKKC